MNLRSILFDKKNHSLIIHKKVKKINGKICFIFHLSYFTYFFKDLSSLVTRPLRNKTALKSLCTQKKGNIHPCFFDIAQKCQKHHLIHLMISGEIQDLPPLNIIRLFRWYFIIDCSLNQLYKIILFPFKPLYSTF